MDQKAEAILTHYRNIISRNAFDEYDILGFLIFIRSYIDKDTYPSIYEICNLVAHRNRDRGTVMSCIKAAYDNEYKTSLGSNVVIGYQGIPKSTWIDEWGGIGSAFQINMTSQTIAELMLCLFSLVQDTEYSYQNAMTKIVGKIEVFQGQDGVLALATTELSGKSPYVCFSKFGPYEFLYKYSGGRIRDVIDTKRIGTELQLWAGNRRII